MAHDTSSITLPPNLLPALGLDTFVAFDVETTGLDPALEQIIELGAVRLAHGQEVDHYTSLIHTVKPLPPFIRTMTGIRNEMLAQAPPAKKALKELLDFIGDDPLIGHNVSFDLGFLHAELKRHRLTKFYHERPCADSALLARVLLPTLSSRSLASLSRYFNLPFSQAHRALPDARQTGLILLHLLSCFPRVDIKSVDILRRVAQGLDHPAAWIFSTWAEYLIKTSSLSGRFQPYQIPHLRENVVGKPPRWTVSSENAAIATEAEALEPISVQEIGAFFDSGGSLAERFPAFEHRPEQIEMARACAEVLNQGGVLAVEAGTGVGKSLAYLVPAITWAHANQATNQRVIVSTNTINLQEQLFFKDLPLLAEALPPSFCAVLLKGRNNYLCRNRWERLITEHPLRLSQGERLSLLPLVLWSAHTRTGDVSEVGVFRGEGSSTLWHQIASEAGSCRGRNCQERGRCFHAQIRAAAAKAHVVVVNHALLMADLVADRIPIGSYRSLVVDEAHHLERAAAQHLGVELNFWLFRSWTHHLYETEGPATGLIARLLLGLGTAKGKHALLPGLNTKLEETAQQVSRVRQAANDFFARLTEQIRGKIPPQGNDYTQKLRLRDPATFLQTDALTQIPLLEALLAVEASLKQIILTLGEISLGLLARAAEWKDEVNGALEELLKIKMVFSFYFAPADVNWVYWAELPRKAEHTALLYAAPLNANEILREKLFAPLRSAILTSATLTVAGRFHYFLRKIGLPETPEVRTLKLGSPFDFPRQMLIGLPAFLASPRQREFDDEVGALLGDLLRRVPSGTLGLFTSYRSLRTVSGTLERELPGRSLLVQGQKGSRDQLLRRFRDEPGTILLGTDSFWEGIDVVGEALELLVVAKLPFEVPSEPLVEARLERLKADGKDPFLYYTVPEAVIRLRQGIGRLIRSKTDRGVALICDSRLIHSRYGQAFRDSLPVAVKVFGSSAELIESLEEFFGLAHP